MMIIVVTCSSCRAHDQYQSFWFPCCCSAQASPPWDSSTRCCSRSGSAPASSWRNTAQQRPCRSLCFDLALLCIDFRREWRTGALYAPHTGGKAALILGRLHSWSSWRWLKQGVLMGITSQTRTVTSDPPAHLDSESPWTWGNNYLFPSLSAAWSQQDRALWLSGVWAAEAQSVWIPWLEGSPPPAAAVCHGAEHSSSLPGRRGRKGLSPWNNCLLEEL